MSIVLGMDFGTDSVRVIAVDSENGRQVAEGSANYPRWGRKEYCDASAQCFRQHPLDHMEAMIAAVRSMVAGMDPADWQRISAIGVDATGSTACPVDRSGKPLALLDAFADDPLAMFHMWKDLSSVEEADEINAAVQAWKDRTDVDYCLYAGPYSAERILAKVLKSIRQSPDIRREAYTWMELTDWIPNLLVGCDDADKLYRCWCGASHKMLWYSRWNGLPDKDFLAGLDPDLVRIAETFRAPELSTACLGTISPEWAQRLNLPEHTLIAGGKIDAHCGAVGAGANTTTVAAVLGTSTVLMTIADPSVLQKDGVRGICAMGENSIMPGYIGLEAGQAAFGDAYAWLCSLLGWGVNHIDDEALTDEVRSRIQSRMLASLIRALPPADAPLNLTMVDWLNGRRHPYVNDAIRAGIFGLSLGTDAPELFRSLIFATVFGTRRLIDGFEKLGVQVENVMAVGGIAQKNPYIMQVMADTFGKRICIPETKQACALGAAMSASVACGDHPDLLTAQRAMVSPVIAEYTPDARRHALYDGWYRKYLRLGEMAEAF